MLKTGGMNLMLAVLLWLHSGEQICIFLPEIKLYIRHRPLSSIHDRGCIRKLFYFYQIAVNSKTALADLVIYLVKWFLSVSTGFLRPAASIDPQLYTIHMGYYKLLLKHVCI
jgi:hypothetical protein